MVSVHFASGFNEKETTPAVQDGRVAVRSRVTEAVPEAAATETGWPANFAISVPNAEYCFTLSRYQALEIT
jgi:hypothetical protein